MLRKSYFQIPQQAAALLQDKVIAIVTEYTIFRLLLRQDRVRFQCLKDLHSFDILFRNMYQDLHLRKEDFDHHFLESLVTYCATSTWDKQMRSYPICEFEDIDKLLDWYLEWEQLAEEEKLEYLESL